MFNVNRDVNRGKKMVEGRTIIAKEICVGETKGKKKKQERESKERDGNEYEKRVNRQR